MSLQVALDEAIKEICPIDGVSFGDLVDKQTWRISFCDDATDEQKAAAQAVVDNFTWTQEDELAYAKKVRNNQYANNLGVKAGYPAYAADHPGDNFSDYLDYLETLNVEE